MPEVPRLVSSQTERDSPADSAAREKTILSIFGSPDRRQIDGLGGADPPGGGVTIPWSRGGAEIRLLLLPTN